MKLGTVREEAARCRAAWKARPNATHALHCHHTISIESLMAPAEDRIRFILRRKPKWERALRLRLFRPLPIRHRPAAVAAANVFRQTYAERSRVCYRKKLDVIHAACCQKGCPWDGDTIFARRVK